MRHAPKWTIVAATGIAAAAIATGAAMPAQAQQSGGQQHPAHASCGITLVPTGTSPDLSTVTPAKPKPLDAVPSVCGQSGTTQAAVRITLVPARPEPADPVG
jgi:hypothetical protein